MAHACSMPRMSWVEPSDESARQEGDSTMTSTPFRAVRNGYVALTLVLVAIVVASLIVPVTPDTVFARRYGKKNYAAKYAQYIARCKGKCGRKNGAINACINRDRKAQVKNCRQIYKADRGLCTDGTCAKDVKVRLKACIRDAGGQARADAKAIHHRGYGLNRCNACCQRTKGQGGCVGYFSSSRFYGSFRYRGRLNCYNADDNPGSGNTCVDQCEALAKRGRAACGKAKRGSDPASCLQQVEQALQTCLAACQPPPPGSPSAAFLGDLSGRIRAHVARWLPWLVEGWND